MKLEVWRIKGHWIRVLHINGTYHLPPEQFEEIEPLAGRRRVRLLGTGLVFTTTV